MELTEPIESINQQLIDLFGIDTITGLPIWRVVWSEDQFEKRLGTYDDFSGPIYIRTVTEVREVPKYRQWIKEKYVLERLVVIPEINKDELPSSNLSYEPIYVFQDGNDNALPPKTIIAKFVIDTVYAAQGKTTLAKYKDPENSQEASLEMKRKRVAEIENELYGDEIGQIGMDLLLGQGISVPSNYKKES